MLTVWAGIWGDKYPLDYLHRLRAGIERHLRTPHRFCVLADRPIAGYNVQLLGGDWTGWWNKLQLFEIDSLGVNLWIDLDSVIVGSLDELVAWHATYRIAMARNWAHSGHDSCQSSVMIWQGGKCQDLIEDLKPQYGAVSHRLWGDQEWITERYGKPGEGIVTPIEHPAVVSYKYHCRDAGAPPPGAKIVTFHGDPKPDECSEPWIQANW